VQVAAPTSHTTGRLPAISPDVTKLLAVMTLREDTLSPVCLYPNGNVAKALKLEDLQGFCRPREDDKEQWEVS
jgi:hypothetical protein